MTDCCERNKKRYKEDSTYREQMKYNQKRNYYLQRGFIYKLYTFLEEWQFKKQLKQILVELQHSGEVKITKEGDYYLVETKTKSR